jgi:hypothetical protein
MSDHEPLDEFHLHLLSVCIAADLWGSGFAVAGYADAWGVTPRDVGKALSVLRERSALVGFRNVNWAAICQQDLLAVVQHQHVSWASRAADIFERFMTAQPGLFEGWSAEIDFMADDDGEPG